MPGSTGAVRLAMNKLIFAGTWACCMGIEPSMRTVGIVLAGGQSHRFGEPKALQHWKGKSFLTYSIDALQPSVDEIVVISHLKELVHLPGVVVREDLEEYSGMGPLAGIFNRNGSISRRLVYCLAL
ncbi:hypothetical protein GCM10020331_030290 [Ectobacillus funiculus]